MADTHETIADIIAEMRGIRVREFQDYADRFEAAHRRERGDAAKLREALGSCLDFIMRLDRAFNPFMQGLLEDAIAKAKVALSAPPRNCDVGTAEEQTERFKAFCQSNMQFYEDMFGHDDEGRLDGWDCREDCPVGRMIDSGTAVADHCQLAWAQMPYEEGGDK